MFCLQGWEHIAGGSGLLADVLVDGALLGVVLGLALLNLSKRWLARRAESRICGGNGGFLAGVLVGGAVFWLAD